MGNVVHDLGNLQVVLFVGLVGLPGSQVLGLAGVVLAPLAQALDHFLHGGVVVTTAHAQNAVAVGLSHGLGHALLAHLNDAVKAVLQRHIVVHHLTALGNGEGVEHHQHAVHDGLELAVTGQILGVLVGDVLHGNAVPVLGHLHQHGDVLLAHAKLLGNGDDLAVALGNIAAARAHHTRLYQ